VDEKARKLGLDFDIQQWWFNPYLCTLWILFEHSFLLEEPLV